MTKIKATAIRMVNHFAQTGSIQIVVYPKRNPTWGWTYSGYFHGDRFETASGCGYDKEVAVLETFIHIITGQYISLGGSNHLEKVAEKIPGFSMVAEYRGENESAFSIRKV